MCYEEPLTYPLPVFETRFTELDELLPFFQPPSNNNITTNNSESSPQTLPSNSGSDDPTLGFMEETDEKKKRRKISNRESAKRSRWRKKRHLEEVTDEANRLKAQNRDYTSRLNLILDRLRAVKTQNELMRFECVRLSERHASLNRVLQDMQYYSQYKDNIVMNNTDCE